MSEVHELIKKTKISTESLIGDIVTSIESIAESVESINQSHAQLLRLNKAVVALKLKIEEKKKKELLQTTIQKPEGK